MAIIYFCFLFFTFEYKKFDKLSFEEHQQILFLIASLDT